MEKRPGVALFSEAVMSLHALSVSARKLRFSTSNSSFSKLLV
jgi:hypothetical protein